MADLSPSFAAVGGRLKAGSLYARCQAAFLDNRPWETASARFLVVRLSPWRDVDRSTPHLFLHRLIRSTLGGDAYIDFAFFPSRPDRASLDAASLPWLSGAVSRRTADEFDAVLVSCSYALELANLPALLLRSGIPCRASARRAAPPAGRPWPLFVLGGSSALAAQGAIFPDGDAFFDAVYFGEGEDGGAAVIRSLAATAGRPTAERARALEEAAGAVWASGFGAPGEPRPDGTTRRVRPGRCRVLPRNADAGETERETSGASPLLLETYPILNSDEASTARLQISWGCPSFCTFCFEGWERKPYRELPLGRALEAARTLARNTGASTLEIYSFNFNAHEDALQLIHELNRVFDKVNMMSQRADILARTPGMLAVELAAEKRSFTVGVEGVSARMRAYYAKDLRDDEVRQLFDKLLREKIRELKLFYIIAGIETEADIAEFGRFCAELRGMADERNPGLRAIFSAGYLVRMPFTPLRGVPLVLDREPLKRIAEGLAAATAASGFEFRLAQDWNEYVADQLLVAGGYGLAAGLEEAAKALSVYDAGIEGDLVGPLVRALRASDELEPPESDRADRSLDGPLVRAKERGHRYPLDFVDASVRGDFLDARAADAAAGTEQGSCMGDEDGDGACLGCDACEDREERAFLGRHRVRPAPALALAERTAAVIKEKRRARPVFLKLVVPPSLAGARPAALSAYLMRTALGAEPRLVGRLLRIEEALWTSPYWADRVGPGFSGETVVALYGIGGDGAGNPALSRPDAETVRAALEAATGAAVSWEDAFDPAALTAASAAVRVPPGQDALRLVRSWLGGLKVAATERKTDAGRLFEIAPKDRKKKIVDRVELVQEEAGAVVKVSGGGKLNLAALLSPGIFATDVTFTRR